MKRLALFLLILGSLGFDFWRADRPVPSVEIPTRMPRLEKQILPGGVELVVHQDSYLPLCHIQLFFRAGIAAEPAAERGTVRLLHRILFVDNEPLLTTLDRFGTEPDVSYFTDGITVSVQVRSEDATAALEALLKALREPSWEPELFARAQKRLHSKLTDGSTSPQQAVWRVLRRTLYPAGHPLAHDPQNDAAKVLQLTLPQVQAFYRCYAVTKNLAVSVTGRIAPAVASIWVKKLVAGLAEGPAPIPVLPPVINRARTAVQLIPFPELTQSVILLGTTAPALTHPDAAALEIAADWLSSNVNSKLRHDKAVTYGVGADYQADSLGGLVTVHGSVESTQTGYAAREVISQLFSATTEPVVPAMMPMYRAHLIRDITDRSASLSGVSGLATEVLRHDSGYLVQRIERIQKVAPDDVYKALRDYVKKDQLAIVVAGDPAKVEPQLKEVGLSPVQLVRE